MRGIGALFPYWSNRRTDRLLVGRIEGQTENIGGIEGQTEKTELVGGGGRGRDEGDRSFVSALVE